MALDGSRIINQTAVGARYQGSFGGVNLLAYGVYMFSGHANYTGPAITYAAARAANSSAGTGQFEDLSFGSMGAAVTVAGVTVGGNWIVGDVNGGGRSEALRRREDVRRHCRREVHPGADHRGRGWRDDQLAGCRSA